MSDPSNEQEGSILLTFKLVLTLMLWFLLRIKERPVSGKEESPTNDLNAPDDELDEPRPDSQANELDNEQENDQEDENLNLEDVNDETTDQHNEPTTENEHKNLEENEENKQSNDPQDENELEGQKEDEKKDESNEVEVVQQKLVKRKARNPNRFADGNLIPEEGDEEVKKCLKAFNC